MTPARHLAASKRPADTAMQGPRRAQRATPARGPSAPAHAPGRTDKPAATNRCHTGIDTPMGPMVLAATPRGLAGAWFAGQRHFPAAAALGRRDDTHPVLQQATRQLQDFFTGQRRQFELALDLDDGTPFQRAVWQALLQLPAGSTCTYSAIAQAIGRPAAVRAVGAAVGRNPVSVIVPCHRVLGADGSLTGYAGGLQRKAWLLALETSAAAAVAAAPAPAARHASRRPNAPTIAA